MGLNGPGPAGADQVADTVRYYRGVVAESLHDRKLVLVAPSGSDLAWYVGFLRDLGLPRPLILASAKGDDSLDADVYTLQMDLGGVDPRANSMEWARLAGRYLSGRPASVQAAVDRFDPSGCAVVLGAIDTGSMVLRRRRLGWRPPAWETYENKTLIDAFWDRAGVVRAPSRIISVETAVAADAFALLDEGAGVVLAGDTSAGIHGGATCVRWCPTADLMEDALAFFRPRCRQVRVMPFLEGVPCTVHGIIFQRGTAVFRPMELIVLRRHDGSFLFAGTSHYWQCSAAASEELRATMRCIAGQLRQEVNYRGGFTLDGVLTTRGFLPTELNPRFGTGLGDSFPVAGLPLRLIERLAMDGVSAEFLPERLEELVIGGMDSRPGVECAIFVPELFLKHHAIRLSITQDNSNVPQHDLHGTAEVLSTPSARGSIISLQLADHPALRGRSLAPFLVRILGITDSEWGTGFGPLQAARPEAIDRIVTSVGGEAT